MTPRSCLPKGYEINSDNRGPCHDDDCGNPGCVSARLVARSGCAVCGRKIGFNNPFFFQHAEGAAAVGGGLRVRHEDCAAVASKGPPKRA